MIEGKKRLADDSHLNSLSLRHATSDIKKTIQISLKVERTEQVGDR